jgi:putative sugar O-methyltransferase
MANLDSEQITDNVELLEEMRLAHLNSDSIYQTSNYWANYAEKLYPYLRDHGLLNFRSDKTYKNRSKAFKGSEILACFSATDYRPIRKMKPLKIVLRILNKIDKFNPRFDLIGRYQRLLSIPIFSKSKLKRIQNQLIQEGQQSGLGTGGLALNKLDISVAGNPSGVFKNGQNNLTESAIYHFQRYAFASRNVNFQDINNIVELASGSGKQAEVFAKLHPHITIFLVDIPPQLYVAHQYLLHVFPDRVVPFDVNLSSDKLSKSKPGQINFLGSWQLHLLREKIDLFWSHASFGEMEPAIVKHFLSLISPNSENIYLAQVFEGKEVALNPGEHGVLEQTVLKHYIENLNDFEIKDIASIGKSAYKEIFWKKKQK